MSPTRFPAIILSPLLFTFLISAPVTASAQSDQCDERLEPLPGIVGYEWRGNRCEGLYSERTHAMPLEIVSLLVGKLRFDLDRDLRLEVSAPDVAGVAEGPVRVRATALPLRTYYRMDAVLTADSSMQWPAKDVLYPKRLGASRIGVFGWVDAEPEKIFVPIWVVQKGKQQPRGSVNVMIRALVDVDTLLWRSHVKGEDTSEATEWHAVVTTLLPAGQPVTIPLPDGAMEMLRVEVVAREKISGEWTTLKFLMVRPDLR